MYTRALEEVCRWLRAWQPSSGGFRAAGLHDLTKPRTRTRIQVSDRASDQGPGQSMIWGEVMVVCNPRALPITSMLVMSQSHAAAALVRHGDEMRAYRFVPGKLWILDFKDLMARGCRAARKLVHWPGRKPHWNHQRAPEINRVLLSSTVPMLE